MAADALFVLNAGSSSLKFRLFRAEGGLPLIAEGRVTGLGSKPEFTAGGETRPLPAGSTLAALLTVPLWGAVLRWLPPG